MALIQDNEVYHYHLDHLGTPRELTNQKGDIVWKVRYKTWGNVALKECEEIENNLRFQGQYFDEETGLHYNRHRYYNPGTGQFINQDPIGLLGGVNNYQYAPNPVGWIDPFGLCKDDADNSGDLDVTKSGDIRVGRWMSKAEHNAMVDTGKVVESQLNGVTSVTAPPNATAWIRQTDGLRFVEFNVPDSAVRANDGITGKIFGPNSIFGPKKGITEMPPATNIQQTVSKYPRIE